MSIEKFQGLHLGDTIVLKLSSDCHISATVKELGLEDGQFYLKVVPDEETTKPAKKGDRNGVSRVSVQRKQNSKKHRK